MDHKIRFSKTFYVYILESLSDGTHYVGYTENLERRLKEHNAGKSRYTSRHIPFKLLYYEEFPSKGLAKDREMRIKRSGGGKKFLKTGVPQLEYKLD